MLPIEGGNFFFFFSVRQPYKNPISKEIVEKMQAGVFCSYYMSSTVEQKKTGYKRMNALLIRTESSVHRCVCVDFPWQAFSGQHCVWQAHVSQVSP